MNTDQMTIEELKALQQKHRKQIIENRNKTLERKQRAHRLIQHGAILENIFPEIKNMSNEELQSYLNSLIRRT